MKTRTLLLALLGILFAWALASQLPYSWWMLSLQSQASRSAELPFQLADYSGFIKDVSPPYRDVGLRPGDEVISLNGIALNGDELARRFFSTAQTNQTVTLLVNREAQTRSFTFRLTPHVSAPSDWPGVIIIDAVLPITCLLVGFYIAFARPQDPLAWLTMAMLASFSQLTGTSTLLLPSPWLECLFVFQGIFRSTWGLWIVLFGLYFPVPFPFIRRNPWIVWLLAVPHVLMGAVEIYGNFERLHHFDRIRWLASFESYISAPRIIWFTCMVWVFFGCLTWKSKTLQNLDSRRRLRAMLWGCSLALTPVLVVVFSELHWLPPLPEWLEAVCLSMLILFPITMAYVIVVQQAMDVRMVVRIGVQYAFARTGIKVVQIALVIVLVAQAQRLARQSNRLVEEILIGVVGTGVVLSVRRLSDWVRAWMDRRFFREAYNAERILTDLSSSVAGIRDVKELLETVTKRISESLHVPGISVFLDRNGAYRPAYALGSLAASDGLEFKRDASVVQFLKRQRAPSKIYFADPQSWIHGTPETEQETLKKLHTQVLLPVTLKNRLLGIISLSGKRSEEPYSRGDLQLLGAVAAQTGLALENAELTESVRLQIAQQERLDRELEIAREVQQRLFPQKLPLVSGLDFAGYCRPAEGVGGDYYDFIHLPDTSLGIAVGDVSGKGIAAALMMASLQASLRGQTIKPCDTLSEMIQHINRLVYEASSESRYATFFYAQYHPATRAMRYVNAGHNPPIVWRRANGKEEFIRLEDGGTVVGLFPESPFCEGLVQLEKGDVLVAFTDGISEAMNDDDEQFEEERLMEVLRKLEARTAAEMIGHILVEVDGFTAGAKQHDDMTLVVVRVQ